MNCRPGDLAIRIKTGQIVSVLRPFDGCEYFTDTSGAQHTFIWSGEAASWVIEAAGSPLKYHGDGSAHGCLFTTLPVRDCGLKPIRDPGEDATDEMIIIAGKPEGVTA